MMSQHVQQGDDSPCAPPQAQPDTQAQQAHTVHTSARASLSLSCSFSSNTRAWFSAWYDAVDSLVVSVSTSLPSRSRVPPSSSLQRQRNRYRLSNHSYPADCKEPRRISPSCMFNRTPGRQSLPCRGARFQRLIQAPTAGAAQSPYSGALHQNIYPPALSSA